MELTELSPRRRQLLDAATRVVARDGMRGLTHRAVDREAGIAQGSTSSYFRTRQALQLALADYVASTLSAQVAAHTEMLACQGPDERVRGRAVELTTGLFLRWLDAPDLLLARLELTLEGARDADVRRLLARARGELVAMVESVPESLGKEHSPDRAEALVASLDGTLLAAMLKPRTQRREFLSRAIERLIPQS